MMPTVKQTAPLTKRPIAANQGRAGGRRKKVAESVEATGKTVEEAIQSALEELGASRDAVTVRVLSAGTGGLFGLGGEESRVLVELKPEGAAEDTGQEEAPGGLRRA